jgi:hypothetical protein
VLGATVSLAGSVVAETVLLDADTFPDPSRARTANWCAVPGLSCRTQAPCTVGRGNVPGVTVDRALGVTTPLTSMSYSTGPTVSVLEVQVSSTFDAATASTRRPFGVVGGVVSASVVTGTRATGEPL